MVVLRPQSNFSQLKAHDEQLERLGLYLNLLSGNWGPLYRFS